jgi:integrase
VEAPEGIVSAFQAAGRTIHHVKFKVAGGWVKRTTGTRDPNTAKKMQRMVTDLGPTELDESDILAAINDNRLTVPQVWAIWKGPESIPVRLKKLRAFLADADLLEKREDWIAEVTLSSSMDTAEHYDHALQSLVDTIGRDGTLPISAVTVEAIKQWIASIPHTTGTKRKYHASVSSFFTYCKSVGAIERNPMRDIPLPPAADARDRHLTRQEARALADAQASPFRELSALLAGTGIEVSVALALRVKDVDVANQEIRARGTKTHNRDRVAKVASWAWKDVLWAIVGKLPDALLFDTITNIDQARRRHQDACEALKIEDYTMRDARHTYAVRMVKAGTPTIQVAKQLGHKDQSMVQEVYGLYEPSQREREHWEQVATARDQTHAKESGQ